MNKVRIYDFAMAFVSLATVTLSVAMLSGVPKTIFALMFGFSFLLCTFRGLRVRRRLPAAEPVICGNTLRLLSEDGKPVYSWDLLNRTSAIIGKSSAEEMADIDLSGSIFSATVEAAHATLNRAAGKWYLEDVSESGNVFVEKDGTSLVLSKGEPCALISGNLIQVAGAKLLFD
jgi:hypothetical protein